MLITDKKPVYHRRFHKMAASSSEDEIDEALKESANCDYIQDLVDKSKTDLLQRTSIKRSQIDTVSENEFENFLAKRLAGRLDEKIKIVERKQKETDRTDLSNGGIRFFSGSPIVSELKEDDYIVIQKKRKKNTIPSADYDERAEAAAVSPDWVKDLTNTAHWKDNKKPRVLQATVVRKHANGAIECTPCVV